MKYTKYTLLNTERGSTVAPFPTPRFTEGSVAEWSKALVLGTSPKGRGFESHRCHKCFFTLFYLDFSRLRCRPR